ncbi:hypothetical protein [Microbulbifer hydrolyticus]|uniref:hypothetical protein n=1 Tax=Microbulbifer hydrolyticus TaxID=48074 RepID=UPI001F162B17|nr:hypothetical protein [Microbulbifer hydrolyticus]
MKSDLKEFIELSKVHASIEYGNPSSVKAGNNAADSMRSITNRFVESGRTEELLELLDNKVAGPWVAFTVVEFQKITKEQRARCLELIRAIASGDSVDSMGAELWLKERGNRHS